ncbi:hypothetical protein L1F30_02010 [Simiduia sp. 21SJ11W-1]|uniref:hypothetical protein n=1 Tax=Simiduia sp. 21SJ11W-1 TaxID=2909669 RepID=UPI00209FDC18|nr:hypothetical protein [Simiduia sp. 21SJ11W-1]UTA48330.1 hypothetical protein L1F30_02010 [Simiduia sp. 21SJ11W-1]
MKKVTDFIFYDSWHVKEIGLTVGSFYLAKNDLRELKVGEVIKFAGFEDVDNHYGRFVFTNQSGQVVVVDGDFCTKDHPDFKQLKETLSNA